MEDFFRWNFDGFFKAFNVQEDVCVGNVAENADVCFEAVAENAENAENDSNEKSNVDCNDYNYEKCCHPHKTIFFALLFETWKFGDLRQHALERHDND